jgi:cell division protein ZapA
MTTTNLENTETKLKILDHDFKIKCPLNEVESLKSSARYVEKKMAEIRGSEKLFNVDRIAVITALNIAHEFLTENKNTQSLPPITKKLSALSEKIKDILQK